MPVDDYLATPNQANQLNKSECRNSWRILRMKLDQAEMRRSVTEVNALAPR